MRRSCTGFILIPLRSILSLTSDSTGLILYLLLEIDFFTYGLRAERLVGSSSLILPGFILLLGQGSSSSSHENPGKKVAKEIPLIDRSKVMRSWRFPVQQRCRVTLVVTWLIARSFPLIELRFSMRFGQNPGPSNDSCCAAGAVGCDLISPNRESESHSFSPKPGILNSKVRSSLYPCLPKLLLRSSILSLPGFSLSDGRN